MTCTELFRALSQYKEYTDSKKFLILGVVIENIEYQGRDAYVFVHKGIQYFALDNFDRPLTDDIQITIYKELRNFLRKKKISKLLNDNC